MKIAALKRFFAIFAVGLSCICCSSDLDFDQVNTIKLEPVFIANLAFFDVPAPDLVINGAEQNIVFDVATVDVFTDKFFRENLNKVDLFTEIENTINRAFDIEYVFLDRDNNVVYRANFSVPAFSGTTNKVNRTDVFENVELDLLKRTTKIAFGLRMQSGAPLTETSSGKLILRSGVTAYLVVE